MNPINPANGPERRVGDPFVPVARPTEFGERTLHPLVWVDGVPVFGSDDSHEMFVPPSDTELDADALPALHTMLVVATDPEQIGCAVWHRRATREQALDQSMSVELFGTTKRDRGMNAIALHDAADSLGFGRPVGRPGQTTTAGLSSLGHPVATIECVVPDPTLEVPGPLSFHRLLQTRRLPTRQLTIWRLRDTAHVVESSCGGPWAVLVAQRVNGRWTPSVPFTPQKDMPSDYWPQPEDRSDPDCFFG